MFGNNNDDIVLISRMGKQSTYQHLCFSKSKKNSIDSDDEASNGLDKRQLRLLKNMP